MVKHLYYRLDEIIVGKIQLGTFIIYLSHGKCVTQQSCDIAKMLHGKLPKCKVVTLQCCHLTMLSLSNVVTLQCCHFAMLSLCNVVTLQCCHLANFQHIVPPLKPAAPQLGSFRQENYTFGKFPLGKFSFGKSPLGKCLRENT